MDAVPIVAIPPIVEPSGAGEAPTEPGDSEDTEDSEALVETDSPQWQHYLHHPRHFMSRFVE